MRQDEIMIMEEVLARRRRLWVLGLKGILAANVIWLAANLLAVLIDINSGGTGSATVSNL